MGRFEKLHQKDRCTLILLRHFQDPCETVTSRAGHLHPAPLLKLSLLKTDASAIRTRQGFSWVVARVYDTYLSWRVSRQGFWAYLRLCCLQTCL